MKKLHYLFGLMLVMALTALWSCSKDDDKDDDRNPVKVNKKADTALLLCSFGSTFPQPQATYDKIVADYAKEFPGTDIYLSFTSRTIVSRVYAQLGKAYAQPDLWLSAIAKAGYKTVYVQSLHIIPGEEYLSLINTDVKKNFMVPNPDIRVAKGACLLNDDNDIDAVADALYKYYKPRLDKGEVVALMGHGNPDKEYIHANDKYDQLEAALQKLSGKANIFIGTVDWGDKMFSHVRDGILAYAQSENKAHKDIIVSLAPLMSIAGDHAQNDMLGDLEPGQKMENVNAYEDDWEAEYSWKIKLTKLGFKISEDGTLTDDKNFNVVGLADHDDIRKVWIDHMKESSKNPESWNEHLGE